MSHLIMHVNKKCLFIPIRNEHQLDADFCQNDIKSTLSLLKPLRKSNSPEKQHVTHLQELSNMSHLVVVVVVVVFTQKDEIRDQIKKSNIQLMMSFVRLMSTTCC